MHLVYLTEMGMGQSMQRLLNILNWTDKRWDLSFLLGAWCSDENHGNGPFWRLSGCKICLKLRTFQFSVWLLENDKDSWHWWKWSGGIPRVHGNDLWSSGGKNFPFGSLRSSRSYNVCLYCHPFSDALPRELDSSSLSLRSLSEIWSVLGHIKKTSLSSLFFTLSL